MPGLFILFSRPRPKRRANRGSLPAHRPRIHVTLAPEIDLGLFLIRFCGSQNKAVIYDLLFKASAEIRIEQGALCRADLP